MHHSAACCAGTTGACLSWLLTVGSRSSCGAPELPAPEPACPVEYRRHTLAELRDGARPYLLGGIGDRPGCAACNRTDGWALPCRFKNGPLCPDWVQRSIVKGWLSRLFVLPLTLTPCDLWPHIRGRTLFIMGDSMSLDFFKVGEPFSSCLPAVWLSSVRGRQGPVAAAGGVPCLRRAAALPAASTAEPASVPLRHCCFFHPMPLTRPHHALLCLAATACRMLPGQRSAQPMLLKPRRPPSPLPACCSLPPASCTSSGQTCSTPSWRQTTPSCRRSSPKSCRPPAPACFSLSCASRVDGFVLSPALAACAFAPEVLTLATSFPHKPVLLTLPIDVGDSAKV